MYYVYILLSQKDNKKYIGSTNDLQRRLYQHNLGLVKSTKGRRPLEMFCFEQYGSEKEARTREKFLKTHKGYIELKKKYGL
ncbi:MAG: GIY-YIG nuclease family protein [bacterium]|nr:GIY-YIG nuclease family protein [bacterium]